MLTQVLQPVTAGLTSAVPLLEQTAQISGGPGKVLPGERLSQAWALLTACLELFQAVGIVWVPVTATGALRNSVLTCNCPPLPVPLGSRWKPRVEVAVEAAVEAACSAGNSRDCTQAVVQLRALDLLG